MSHWNNKGAKFTRFLLIFSTWCCLYVVFKALENDHVCGVSDSEALTESELDVTSDTFSDSSKNYQVRTRGKRSVLNARDDHNHLLNLWSLAGMKEVLKYIKTYSVESMESACSGYFSPTLGFTSVLRMFNFPVLSGRLVDIQRTNKSNPQTGFTTYFWYGLQGAGWRCKGKEKTRKKQMSIPPYFELFWSGIKADWTFLVFTNTAGVQTRCLTNSWNNQTTSTTLKFWCNFFPTAALRWSDLNVKKLSGSDCIFNSAHSCSRSEWPSFESETMWSPPYKNR